MALSDIFKVFSKRTAYAEKPLKQLTQTFRTRVFLRCNDLFSNTEFWIEIHTKFTYLLGQTKLSKRNSNSALEDILRFLETCSDEHFLDFIEYIFVTNAYTSNASELVNEINEFLLIDALPYALTNFVWIEEEGEDRYGPQVFMRRESCPQVIRKDSEVIFENAIEPTLNLLRESIFKIPNKEYLQALEDYKKSDYGDCLAKCSSAFESVLKVICAQNGWTYNEADTASWLLKKVIEKSSLELFFEQPLILVATLRNKLSTAHGGGSINRDVSKAKSEYALNATASAILLVVKETL